MPSTDAPWSLLNYSELFLLGLLVLSVSSLLSQLNGKGKNRPGVLFIASSRRLVSQGAPQKTGARKIKKKRGERKRAFLVFRALVFCAAP